MKLASKSVKDRLIGHCIWVIMFSLLHNFLEPVLWPHLVLRPHKITEVMPKLAFIRWVDIHCLNSTILVKIAK